MKKKGKYQNNLGWCKYPYTGDNAVSCCWSYWAYVDGSLRIGNGKKIDTPKKLKAFCKQCEFFKTKKEAEAVLRKVRKG